MSLSEEFYSGENTYSELSISAQKANYADLLFLEEMPSENGLTQKLFII